MTLVRHRREQEGAATAEEKPRLWGLILSIFARYDAYQEKASQDIPVVIMERVG